MKFELDIPILEISDIRNVLSMKDDYGYLKIPITSQVISIFKSFTKDPENFISFSSSGKSFIIKNVAKNTSIPLKMNVIDSVKDAMKEDGKEFAVIVSGLKDEVKVKCRNWLKLMKFIQTGEILQVAFPVKNPDFPMVCSINMKLSDDYTINGLCAMECFPGDN